MFFKNIFMLTIFSLALMSRTSLSNNSSVQAVFKLVNSKTLAQESLKTLELYTNFMWTNESFNKEVDKIIQQKLQKAKDLQLDEHELLSHLQQLIDDKIVFYENRMKNNNRYVEAAKTAGAFFAVGLICAACTYLTYKYFYLGSKNEIRHIRKVLLPRLGASYTFNLGNRVSTWGPVYNEVPIKMHLRRILALNSWVNSSYFLEFLGILGTCFAGVGATALVIDECDVGSALEKWHLLRENIRLC